MARYIKGDITKRGAKIKLNKYVYSLKYRNDLVFVSENYAPFFFNICCKKIKDPDATFSFKRFSNFKTLINN